MSPPIRILIVDENPILRAGFRCLLNREPGIVVVGEAADGAESIAQAKTLLPTVILLDLVLPSESGLATIAVLRQQIPAARILVLTDMAHADSALQAIRAGAAGCLLKTIPIPALTRAIHTVAAGDIPVHSSLATKLVRTLNAPRPMRSLSQREQQTLQLLAQGLSNREIADKLYIAKGTVYIYIHRLFSKLRLADRNQARYYALASGLVQLNETPAAFEETCQMCQT
jgi:NarL family two-component system response regulator LiaR